MKSTCTDAKERLTNCVLYNEGATDEGHPLSPTLSLNINNNFIAPMDLEDAIILETDEGEGTASLITSSSPTATLTTTNTSSSTYDALQQPFKYDKKRGRWSSATDFYFACTSHAFGTIVFSELPVYALLFGGVTFLPAYIFAIFLYAIPIFIIQTFLGQFSTSGTISAFRVAPIFKGIGYSILLLNFVSLCYYAIIAAVPLIYAANSLHSVIPWMSCDNAWNTYKCSMHHDYDVDEMAQNTTHMTIEFFRSVIRSKEEHKTNWSLSWQLVFAVLSIWLLTLGITLKRISFIGKFLRCACILMMTFFLAIFVHLLIQAQISWSTFIGFFEPTLEHQVETIFASIRGAIFMATWLLGPGWGSVLNLASHNRFKQDSQTLTYWVSSTHIILALMAMITGRIALDNFEDHVGLLHFHIEEAHQMQFLYLCFSYLFGNFTDLPHFWCFLFFFMLFIAELCAVIIQFMTLTTSLFDEYESLRKRKSRIKGAFAVLLAVISVYFCTKQGFDHLSVLPTLAVLTHVTISLILLLMVTWIYGRDRFQCDLQFMLGKTISNIQIFFMRFVTPVFIVISICQIFYLLELENPPSEVLIISQSVVYVVALTYMMTKFCRSRGAFRNRLKQCFEPHDWHPVDADNWRFYEEVMGTSEMLVLEREPQIMVN